MATPAERFAVRQRWVEASKIRPVDSEAAS
jgi:hypothetical protein